MHDKVWAKTIRKWNRDQKRWWKQTNLKCARLQPQKAQYDCFKKAWETQNLKNQKKITGERQPGSPVDNKNAAKGDADATKMKAAKKEKKAKKAAAAAKVAKKNAKKIAKAKESPKIKALKKVNKKETKAKAAAAKAAAAAKTAADAAKALEDAKKEAAAKPAAPAAAAKPAAPAKKALAHKHHQSISKAQTQTGERLQA